MSYSKFICGMSLGLMAGAALGVSVLPRKRRIKRAAEKVMRTAGEAMGDLTDALGF